MTTDKVKEIVDEVFAVYYSEYMGQGEYTEDEAQEALDTALNALDEVEKYKQIIEDIKDIFIDSLIFGELWAFNDGKISVDDVIHEMNRVFKNEVMQAINKHIKGVKS